MAMLLITLKKSRLILTLLDIIRLEGYSYIVLT